jgi:hypothetical protein
VTGGRALGALRVLRRRATADAAAPTGRLLVDLPGAVPGWLVRVLVAALVPLCAVPVVTDPRTWGVVGVLFAVAALRPDGLVPAGLAALIAVRLLAVGDVGLAALMGLVLGVHLVAAGCVFSRHVAWRGLVDPAALGRVLWGLLPVQLVSQALVLAVAAAARVGPAAAGGFVSLGLRAAAVLALVGVGVVAVPRWRRR